MFDLSPESRLRLPVPVVSLFVTPANIFVTKRGQAKLLVFGLAKLAPDSAAGVDRSGMRTATNHEMMTSPGSTVGTVAYMSPEQVRAEEIDARTDLFACGAGLYEMARRIGLLGKQQRRDL